MNSAVSPSATTVTQTHLLRSRRLLPLFLTQFGGAFNDNFYKSALLMLFTYGGIERWGLSINVVNNLVSAMLIVPFLLFASMAGQFADKYEKSRLIRGIKLAEIAIMLAAGLALWLNSPAGLLLILFFTGMQSACFSPLKYAILPQHVQSQELTGANGLLHTGTSMAIFLGLIAGSLAIQMPGGRMVVALSALMIALSGWWVSRMIPPAEASDSSLVIEWRPLRQAWRTLSCARENRTVLCAIFGISWYWFLGSVYLTQLPNFTRSVLLGSPVVVTLLLSAFLVGICCGALLCEKLSRRRVEPGVVPLGAIAIACFGFDLYFAGESLVASLGGLGEANTGTLYTIADLWVKPMALRVMFDIVLLGVAGGIYIVPLAALMQSRSRETHRAQVVAANNVVNAFFMVAAAVLGAVGLGVLGLNIPQLFLIVTLMHVALCVLIFIWEPEFIQCFYARFFRRLEFK